MDILWILWCNCKFRSMDFPFFSSDCYKFDVCLLAIVTSYVVLRVYGRSFGQSISN